MPQTTLENFLVVAEIIVIGLFMVPTITAAVKGAPWVPTPMARVKKMLEIADIKPGDKVYDLGCGDGRLVHLAAQKYQANAVGYELSPLIYFMAKIRQFLWNSRAKIYFKDFRSANLHDADVIVCYLLPESLKVFQKKFKKELRKGTKIVSYAFRIADWPPSRRLRRNRKHNFAPIWVYEM